MPEYLPESLDPIEVIPSSDKSKRSIGPHRNALSLSVLTIPQAAYRNTGVTQIVRSHDLCLGNWLRVQRPKGIDVGHSWRP
jgi:hypothetical protein